MSAVALCGNRRMPRYLFMKDTMHVVQPEEKRSDIQEQKILARLLTTQYPCLYCGSIRNSFVRIDPTMQLFAVKEADQKLSDLRDTS
mmetsp:Transcript_53982/g.135685  ORF Transcript_53982/g.135685 Transcript_53982/m.135685 type:complete len:87 (+) Transcript_53982:754-1014(+)